MMRRNLSEGSDESPRDVQQLEATERRLARRLQLLDELKARDLHECSWTGDARLVAAHLDDAARKGGLRARKDVKAARKKLRALEREADAMARRQSSDGEASECEIAVAYDEKVDDAREALQAAEARVEVSEGGAPPPRTWSTRRSSARATGRSTTRPTPATTRSWPCC